LALVGFYPGPIELPIRPHHSLYRKAIRHRPMHGSSTSNIYDPAF